MLKIFLRISLLLLIAVGVSGCLSQLVTPRPYGMAETPDGSPTFQQGWNDGCETGLNVYGNDRYKVAYGFTQDPKLILNDEYYNAWKDAYTYCRWYAYNWVRKARH